MNILDIPHELIPINLLKDEQHSDSYKQINPLGTVPAIQTEAGNIIWQSLAIIDYLDGGKKLLPCDRDDRALCLTIANTICAEIQPLQNLSVLSKVEQLGGTTARSDWALLHNRSKLGIIEHHLIKNNTKCAVSDSLSLADICIVPQLYSAQRFGIDIQREFPKMFAIAKRLESEPAFEKSHPHSQRDCPSEIKRLGTQFR